MVNRDIELLSQETIDKIAAGEVVERPSSVVKELVENAIDAGSTAVTIEIREGGIDYIRITDNGCGIRMDQIRLAFLPHSTSKIRSTDDLAHVQSLGFRGEALSSIAAVSRVELITKTKDAITGARYVIEGSREVSLNEIGAPDGTTFVIRQLFYNTPARRKFLKTPNTEGNYITEIAEKLALSHPEVAFRLIVNGRQRMQTAGGGQLRDAIYQIYGRDIALGLLPIRYEREHYTIEGFIGKPSTARGNRSFENFFIDHRYVKSRTLSKSLEDGYKGFMMQHQFPLCVLNITFPSGSVDVNVHPTKLEVRFQDPQDVYDGIVEAISHRLLMREDIENVPVYSSKPKDAPAPSARKTGAEPFEKNRLKEIRREVQSQIRKDSPYEPKYPGTSRFVREQSASNESDTRKSHAIQQGMHEYRPAGEKVKDETVSPIKSASSAAGTGDDSRGTFSEIDRKSYTQPAFFTEEARKQYQIIGQVFDTYWIIQYQDKMYIIDQHAAHEKVLYERTMAALKTKDMTSQLVSPPAIVTLSSAECDALEKYMDAFCRIGFEIEPFGGREYAVTGVPANLFNIDPKGLFMDMIAQCVSFRGDETSDLVLERVASMSCKAAVKGNMHMSRSEIEALISELLTLDNPYHCPHGRPTIIAISHYELDRKFKRIVS